MTGTDFKPGDRVEIPKVTGRVHHVNREGEVWVTLDGTGQNWVMKPERLRKVKHEL